MCSVLLYIEEWYWWLRVLGIVEGVLTRHSNYDVCRTTIKAFVRQPNLLPFAEDGAVEFAD